MGDLFFQRGPWYPLIQRPYTQDMSEVCHSKMEDVYVNGAFQRKVDNCTLI